MESLTTSPLSARRRKAVTRCAPNWIDALALDDDAVLPAPLPPNAAERWDAELPSPTHLAIAAERARRDERVIAPDTQAESVAWTSHESGARDWPWTLATLALLASLVVICAWTVH